MIIISKHFLLFIFYSFVGWVLEEIHASYKEGELLNRGFLIGPICPIYGFASIFITDLLVKYKEDALVLFVLSMIVCGLLEYFVSLLLEKIFKVRWWDYSTRKFNIEGRVTLSNLLLFGIAAVVIVYFVHPGVVKFIDSIPQVVLIVFAIIIFILFALDTLFSVKIIKKVSSTLEKVTLKINKDSTKEIKAKVDKILKDKLLSRRFFKAYPNFKINFDLEEIKKRLRKKR